MKARARLKRRDGCGSTDAGLGLASLSSIIRAYQRFDRPRLVEQLNSFKQEADVSAAVTRAALARRPDGKRYGHQRRIASDVLNEVRKHLTAAQVGGCRSFGELHELIEASIGAIPGVGLLMVYDTALRIGAKLGVQPERVYLHHGTRSGARALRLNYRQPTLEVSELPMALRALVPHEVEDLLCIYKSELLQVAG